MITGHSFERAKERCGIKNQRAVSHSIERAILCGLRAEECTSWEKQYLDRAAGDESVAIAYNGFCYIVSQQGYCITMYALPRWFGKKKHFDGKERIRDYKKYCKNNSDYQELFDN